MAKRSRRWTRWLGGILVALLAIAGVYRHEIVRAWRFARLFESSQIVSNFQRMDELFSARVVRRGGPVSEFARGSYTLPAKFTHSGRSFDTEEFLARTVTVGLLVLHDDRIVHERYERGYSERGHHIAWSVSKSIISALFGIAVGEGKIRDLMQPVTDYVPELRGSGYDGVPIKHVLQMSSGVGFDEDYGNPSSDINRMGRVLALGGKMLDFAASLRRVREPGTLQHYVSIDTQVLGMILVRATGRDLAAYTEEKLWKPLGMESDAYWMLDGTGMELAFGGFNAGLRDFARFGRLYLNEGNWNGRQILPRDWVKASVTPDAPHIMPGPKPNNPNLMGYGYHWWVPVGGKDDFIALGVYNQMIYVDPPHRLVIVKNSANPDFQRDNFEPTREHLSLWRTIAADLAERGA